MRAFILLLLMLAVSGCTAMMVGGANSGGYEPAGDECAEDDPKCR